LKILTDYLSKPDALRLKKAYHRIEPDNFFPIGEEMVALAGHVNAFDKFGTLPLDVAVMLYGAGLAELTRADFAGDTAMFLTVEVSKKLVTASNRFLSLVEKAPEQTLMDELGYSKSSLLEVSDPFVKNLHDQFFPMLVDPERRLPPYAGWGRPSLLMSKSRLESELKKDDWGPLLHRTPYRPFPDEKDDGSDSSLPKMLAASGRG
jgi:hypothetical protein